MDRKPRGSKWHNIFSSIIITTIPYPYVRKIIVHHNNEAFIVINQSEFEETISSIVKTSNTTFLSLQSFHFDVDFNTRKFKKEVKNRVDSLFSKYCKS